MSDVATTSTVPTLTALLRSAITNYMFDVFGGFLPGRVQSYDAIKRVAIVEILVQEVEYLRDGTRSVTGYPLLQGVPIVFPGNSSGAMIRWTPKNGDHLLVLFGARAIDRFLSVGGLVDPQDTRMHDINDAIALPVANFDLVHVADASPQIEFTGTEIHAGGSSALALHQKLLDLKSAIQGWTPVPNDGGAALKTALVTLFVTWPGSGTANLKGG